MVYLKVVKKVDTKSSHYEEKIFFPFTLFVYLHDMNLTKYIVSYFIIYVSQLIMLCTLIYTVLYVKFISIILKK